MKRLLIRAEDKNQWERRSPLIPQDLQDIVRETGAAAFVQASPKRFFKDSAYQEAGAGVVQTMDDGDVVLGVKEIPKEKILDNKVYLFFSHTIKGQTDNMPMLKRIMDSGSTLIDYERIVDDNDRRLVFFGRYAGDAGALNILWLMGEYWQHQEIETPFTECRQALYYHSVQEAKTHLRKIGETIKAKGLPAAIAPMTIGILGYGNVSKGAQNIFDALPTERIAPENLTGALAENRLQNDRIYLVIFEEKHLVQPKGDFTFDLQDYYQNPHKYVSRFDQYLPYLTILVNATYWDSRYPRFVTWDNLNKLYTAYAYPKLQGIADITCDVNGSIECNVRTTDSGQPAYLVQPEIELTTEGHKGEGIVLLAVDNLPAELPNDASAFFSNQLKPFIAPLLRADFSGGLEQSNLPPALKKATIVYKGKLTEDYDYLKEYLSVKPPRY
ncbi:MAG: hypothetical protein GF313_05545 [Caldithrix sp.]|nr:hypothetical protein [Caldithrix sp.]